MAILHKNYCMQTFLLPCDKFFSIDVALVHASCFARKSAVVFGIVHCGSMSLNQSFRSPMWSLVMRYLRIALMAALTSVPAAVTAQSLPTQKVMTLDLAQTIAHETMTKCRADGYRVTVVVVDASNLMKVFLRDDGASLVTLEMARIKATTAVSLGRPSGPPQNLPPDAPVPPPNVPGTVNVTGGVPIRVGDQLIGAVGVSGAPGPGGDRDLACANAALAKVANKLE